MSNDLDQLSQDEVLVTWNNAKAWLEQAKEYEMEIRKYVVSRAFPKPKEGVNKLELGNGYELKAGVKFNYNLKDVATVKNALYRISEIGNRGAFIADKLISWTPNFLLTEYRQLEKEAEEGSEEAKAILIEVHSMLNITDAAPSLEIKAPKVKK